MVTITYAPLGPQYGAMQSLHYVRDDAVWLNMISLVRKRNPRYLKRTHKFGIKLPKTVKEAFELDKKSGNTLWADAIAKELRDIRVTFSILPDGQPAPVGYQKIPCH